MHKCYFRTSHNEYHCLWCLLLINVEKYNVLKPFWETKLKGSFRQIKNFPNRNPPSVVFTWHCRFGSACVRSSLAPSGARRWDTLIGSAPMTFSLLSSLSSTALPSPPTAPLFLRSLLAPLALGGTQEPRGGRRGGGRGVGLQQPRPWLTCFNNFLRPLWNYANILVQFPRVWSTN